MKIEKKIFKSSEKLISRKVNTNSEFASDYARINLFIN